MDLDALRQTQQSITAWFERIFPNRAPAVQAILDYSHAMAKIAQPVLEDPGPTFVKRQPLAGIRNNSPSQRVRVNKKLMHRNPHQTVYAPRSRVVIERSFTLRLVRCSGCSPNSGGSRFSPAIRKHFSDYLDVVLC